MSEIDKHYWNSLRVGESDSLHHLYQCLYSLLYQRGLTICYDPDLVKDTIHAVFLELWDKRERLPEVDNVSAYIYVSFKRRLLRVMSEKHISAKVQVDEVVHENIAPIASYEEKLILDQDEQQRREQLKSLIEQLPPRQRELINLKYYDGLSYEEIAKLTGLSIQSVYNQINIALKTFRQKSKKI